MVTTLALLCLAQLLQPVGVPGKPWAIQRAGNGAWLLRYSEAPRAGDPDALEANGRWYRVPGGEARSSGDWVIISNQVPFAGTDAGVSFHNGMIPLRARRVVLLNVRTGQRIDAPWDTAAAEPTGDGEHWFLIHCGETQARVSRWSPRTREDVPLGPTPEPCQWYGVRFNQAGSMIELATDGGSGWFRVNADGGVTPSSAPPPSITPPLPRLEFPELEEHTERPHFLDGGEVRALDANGDDTSLSHVRIAGDHWVADEGVYRAPAEKVAWGWPPARVFRAEPVPVLYAWEVARGPSGALFVTARSMGSEFGTTQVAMLRVGSRWVSAPTGVAYEWGPWVVFETFESVPRPGDVEPVELPAGASYTTSQGTDDVFVRRVVLLNRATGRRVNAPWDTRTPVPLGDGAKWLLLSCASGHVLRWTVADGRVEDLGPSAVAGEGFDCESKAAQSPSALTRSQAGTRPRAAAGPAPRPFVLVEPVRGSGNAPLLVDGAPARIMLPKRRFSAGVTATEDGEFTLVDGWLFARQGVCQVGKRAVVSFANAE